MRFAAIALLSISAYASAGTLALSVCYGHGCSQTTEVTLDESEFSSVRELFLDVKHAAHEREQIASAIAMLEILAGAKTRTSTDRAGTGLAWPGQMDCIDESANTTAYLALFAREGLLRWHAVEANATRGWLLFGWPHTTAVIREVASGERFAVDSWFFDNGAAPAIVPLTLWRSGWTPP
jgi:hypothetical protein